MRYWWSDFEPDEADKIPNKWILTIWDDEEEYAIIVHRVDSEYPATALDGKWAEEKRNRAHALVVLLNSEQGGI